MTRNLLGLANSSFVVKTGLDRQLLICQIRRKKRMLEETYQLII